MEPRMSIVTLGTKDIQRAFDFYHHGLGFPTSGKPEDGILFFKTKGTCLAVYPHEKLAEDVGPSFVGQSKGFSGVTIAHNVKEKGHVDQVLEQAQNCGAKIEKKAQDTFWGGYSGYFSDPDGHLWEVAWGAFDFDNDGHLLIP